MRNHTSFFYLSYFSTLLRENAPGDRVPGRKVKFYPIIVYHIADVKSSLFFKKFDFSDLKCRSLKY